MAPRATMTAVTALAREVTITVVVTREIALTAPVMELTTAATGLVAATISAIAENVRVLHSNAGGARCSACWTVFGVDQFCDTI